MIVTSWPRVTGRLCLQLSYLVVDLEVTPKVLSALVFLMPSAGKVWLVEALTGCVGRELLLGAFLKSYTMGGGGSYLFSYKCA